MRFWLYDKFPACVCGLILFLIFPVYIVQAAYQTLEFNVFTKSTPYWDGLQFNMVVSDAGSDRVDFTFNNTSLLASSIAKIYFENGSLLSIAQITEGNGTNFIANPAPSNLPAWNLLSPPFEAVKELSIGSVTPLPQTGINPGEWLTIGFNLKPGGSYQSVIDELRTGDLRVGLHVTSLPYGSESAVSIPEPATIFLLGLGILSLLIKRRA
jgi:hypothetical protein